MITFYKQKLLIFMTSLTVIKYWGYNVNNQEYLNISFLKGA